MMRFVGIDPALGCTGVAVYDTCMVTFSVKTSLKDGLDYDRQRKITIDVCNRLHQNDVVILEDFGISGMASKSSGKLAERIELCGMLKFLVPTRTGYPFLLVRPNHLKMFVAGQASVDKAAVRNAVTKIWQIETANHDESDAAALALIGRAMVTGQVPTTFHKCKTAVQKTSSEAHNVCVLRRIRFCN